MNVNQAASRVLRLIALPALALSTLGQVVVPGSFTSAEGPTDAGSFSPFGGGFGSTLQILVEQSQLGLSVNDTITGIRFRANGGGSGTAPSSAASFTSLQITVGRAATTAETMSTTLANNFQSSTVVRSGALTLGAGSFTLGSTPNAFGPLISFNTPFVYQGGDLVFEIRSSGTSTTLPLFDASLQSPSTTYNSAFSFGSTATSGSVNNATPIMQLAVTPVPEPASVAVVSGASLAAFALIRRVRR